MIVFLPKSEFPSQKQYFGLIFWFKCNTHTHTHNQGLSTALSNQRDLIVYNEDFFSSRAKLELSTGYWWRINVRSQWSSALLEQISFFYNKSMATFTNANFLALHEPSFVFIECFCLHGLRVRYRNYLIAEIQSLNLCQKLSLFDLISWYLNRETIMAPHWLCRFDIVLPQTVTACLKQL